MTMPTLGEVLADKYRLDRLLGEGGFGVVFAGTTLSTQRPVAIKFLKPAPDRNAEIRAARFVRELRTVAQLQSEHTMTLYDFGRTEHGVLYMVCELVVGEDLLDLIKRSAPLAEPDVVHVMKQVLLSLEEAHRLGVLHRDVKPSNIRVCRYRDDSLRVKVLDFGLAKSWEGGDDARLTATGKAIGTPRYMAFEQLTGRPLAPCTDLFALGLVAAEMLCGREVTEIRTGQSPLDRRQVDARVSRPLAAVVNKMLEIEPQKRFSSARQVLAELQRLPDDHDPPNVVTNEPGRRDVTTDVERALAEPANPSKPAAPRIQGRRVAASVGLLLLVAVAAAIFVSGLSLDPPHTPTVAQRRHAIVVVESTSDVEGSAAIADVGHAEDCTEKSAFRPGIHEISALDGLVQEQVFALIPPGYDPTRKHAVVMAYGDLTQNRRDVLRMIGITSEENDPFVVVAPASARIGVWSSPEVLQGAARTLRLATRLLCLDDRRVFALGHGAGADGAFGTIPEIAYRAMATTTLREWRFDLHDDVLIPYRQYAPRHDPFHPWGGGENCHGTRIVPHVEAWAELQSHFGCEGREREIERGRGHRCTASACRVPLSLCAIDGGASWASATWAGPCPGPHSEFAYRDHIWAFFRSVAPE